MKYSQTLKKKNWFVIIYIFAMLEGDIFTFLDLIFPQNIGYEDDAPYPFHRDDDMAKIPNSDQS
jgi:hypothetical protein